MDSASDFDNVIMRLKAGDQAAATELFDRFARRLIGLARSRLNPQIQRKVDPEDIVQSVFRSFFQRQEAGEFELINWESLWGLLTLITIRKCGHTIDFFRAARRSVGVEQSALLISDEYRPFWEAVAGDATASQAAALTETLQSVLQSLDERDREIFDLYLQNHEAGEISQRAGRSERTVRRVLERIRSDLEALLT